MNPYILPKKIKPIKYYIDLTPSFDDLTFIGKEKIELEILNDSKEIILNSQDLSIISCKLGEVEAKKIIHNKKYQQVRFSFSNIIKKGIINLDIKFNGKVREDLRGLYKSTYLNNNKEMTMLTTQFEPTDARKCFPCLDEPDLKAKFYLKLNIPKNLDAVSNMPIKNHSIKNNLKEITFEETPAMSTYLLAFVIGQLEYVEGKSKDGVLVRIITTPGKKERAKFALSVAVKSLNFYNDYFKIPYPLPKLDLIAIPDFESGAMENWGLITYRETQLLFDEKNSSAGIKQAVVHTINHEIAHQWFGNLVTMKWWNDLWLNEGFASWIEYKVTDYLFPEFDIWTQYQTDIKTPALYLDSLENSHPIEINVINPSEINEIFDSISYNKGSAIIRMLEQYLGEDKFREGLKYYLKKFKYDNATTEDLWNSLEIISKKPIKELMHSWTRQIGYPIISITKSNKIILEQERFSYLNKNYKTTWKIPIKIVENNKIKEYSMNSKTLELNHYGKILINPRQIGFYRVKYDNNLLNKINYDLKIVDKIGMQNDLFALSRACKVYVKDYIEFIRKFKHETNYALWDDISTSIGKIQLLFYEKYSEKIDEFSRDLFSEIYKKIGWDEKPKEDHTKILLRANVLAVLGFSDHKEVIEEAKKRFKEYLNGKILNPNLRSIIYNLNAYTGHIKTFEILKNKYMEEKNQEEKMRLLASLGIFKQKEILRKALEFSLSRYVRNQDAMMVLAIVANNEYADDLAWNFLKKNWKEYYKRYNEGHVLGNLIKSILGKYKTLEKLKEVKEFFDKNEINAKRAIQQALEMIKINYNFVKYNKDLGL